MTKETTINPSTSLLLTDLYQLTMLQGYLRQGMEETAVFEFSVRDIPENRGFLMVAGLESVVRYLEEVRVTEEELDYLTRCGRFSREVVDYLGGFRFTGDVQAMPEGTVFFPQEPVIRVVAPLPQAQLLETRIMNLIHVQILMASKAARCVLAAGGKAGLIDFGVRRSHGAEAGIFAARSSYIAGFEGTSTVLAEPLYGIPIFGTMAHSFIEAYGSEQEAFIAFARANPRATTLLIDTYDTLRGAARAVETARILEKEGIKVNGVRLDSGDVEVLSKEVRKILDEGGLENARIFVSGHMDEMSIRDLLSRGAPIGWFGVGTKLDTSADAPYLDCAYKLMEYGGKPRFKKSEGKETWPGRKQVYRSFREGIMTEDLVTLEDGDAEGVPLLEPVMKGGRQSAPLPGLEQIRSRAKGQLASLPEHLRALESSPRYPVRISPLLRKLRKEMEEELG